MRNLLCQATLTILALIWCGGAGAFAPSAQVVHVREASLPPRHLCQKQSIIMTAMDRRSALSGLVLLSLAARGVAARGYEKGQPIPTPKEQTLWGTRLGEFTLESDGYDALRREIVEMVVADRTLGPALVRLAFHSSGTYDKLSRTGGSSRGTIRFDQELRQEANAGIAKILAVLEPVKQKYPAVSYADLYTLAGALSVEALGGPHIAWKGGRVDAIDPREATPYPRLPDPDKGSLVQTMRHLRDVFGRMGFNDKEIVALSGAHNLGRCHYEDSGYEGEWSETPWKFDNSYFNILLQPLAMAQEGEENWVPVKLSNGKIQYTDPNRVYIMLPSDLALLQDPKTSKWDRPARRTGPVLLARKLVRAASLRLKQACLAQVEEYARNSPLFFKDFSVAFSKLLALGT